MAGEETQVTSKSGKYSGRITSFLVLSCVVAAMGGAIFGYNLGISGGVSSMDAFLKKFLPNVFANMKKDTKASNYCKFNSQLLTLFSSSLYVASLASSFFASSVTRHLGRRPSILVAGTAYLTGAALASAASNIYMLILGRVLLGVGIGFGNQECYSFPVLYIDNSSNVENFAIGYYQNDVP